MDKILVLSITCSLIVLVSSEIKNCDIHDTVNITDSELLLNGSYLYNGIVIPNELTGIYDYSIYGGGRVPEESHLRGCICQLKTCVKLCCPLGSTGEPNTWNCVKHDSLVLYVNITLSNGSVASLPMSNEFEMQIDIPCLESYSLVPDEDPDHEWILFENGTLALPQLNKYMTKNEYCLNPQTAHNGEVAFMTPMHCKSSGLTKTFFVNNCCMAISVPFLLLTATVYMIVNTLRTLHGKCLISYFISLAIGYGCLVTLNFNPDVPNGPCRILGYSAYFSFISAYAWLSVISFDLWFNINNYVLKSHRFRHCKQFIIYSISAWGLSAILTAITIFIQYFVDIPIEWKPRIGSDEYCWLPTKGWSPMLYFYDLMLISMIFNSITFISTAREILKAKGDTREGFRSHKQNYILFVRLFILLGLTWLLEIGSFLVGEESDYSFIFIPADFLNAIQGIIVFIICAPRMLKALKERYGQKHKKLPTAFLLASRYRKTSIQPTNHKREEKKDISLNTEETLLQSSQV